MEKMKLIRNGIGQMSGFEWEHSLGLFKFLPFSDDYAMDMTEEQLLAQLNWYLPRNKGGVSLDARPNS